jgi:alkylation response protein AidB-like acyl-CoA dehydrogenase
VRFGFSDEQRLFASTVRDLLDSSCSPERLRQSWGSDEPDGTRWAALAEMGVTGLTVPEAHGGLGMDECDLVLVAEETGRAALPEPLVHTVAVTAPLLAEVGGVDADRWLPRIAAGELRVVTAIDGRTVLDRPEDADVVLLADGDDIHAAAPGELRLLPQTSVDGSRRVSEFLWQPTSDTLVAPDAGSALRPAKARGVVATSAQLLGLTQRLLDMTVGYVTEREQFGQPIGSFQAIKHHLADALLALEFARPVVYRGAQSIADAAPTMERDASMAKVFANEAAGVVGRVALQCHGAIAYTVEYDLHLYLKRTWALIPEWGDTAHHREQVARTLLDGA